MNQLKVDLNLVIGKLMELKNNSVNFMIGIKFSYD